MSESYEEQLNRVQMMSEGCDTWDLSDNDIAALKAVLARLKAAKDDTADLDWLSAQKYLCFGIGHFDDGWRVQIETGGYAERGMTLREAIRKARKN